MQTKTAEMLTEAIRTATSIAVDNRNKLTAFEVLLHKHDLNLFQEYSKILENVQANPPTSVLPESFANLLSKLVHRDQ
jgi:hypothetical protein